MDEGGGEEFMYDTIKYGSLKLFNKAFEEFTYHFKIQ
jgi:hypothetical protein